MINYKIMILFLMLASVFTDILEAKEYHKTSYYVAYDKNDATQYVLVLPSVNKIYTHQAGYIKTTDLKSIYDQFVSFPTYDKGKLCFSKLKNNTFPSYGADTMANSCYDVKFFYTQKEILSEGVAFMLFYSPLNKVYEGLAGDAKSFEVVRNGNKIYNENSITDEDYLSFKFDIETAYVTINEPSVEAKFILPPTTDILPILPNTKGE